MERLPVERREQRRTDAPSAHVARIGWILMTLIRDGVVEYAACLDRFGISRREFQRDLLKIREIGKVHGLVVSRMNGGRVLLHASGVRRERLGAGRSDVMATLERVVAAFGEPVESELGEIVARAATGRDGFLQVRQAAVRDGANVARTFAFLKAAAAGPARVEFAYTPARGGRALRRVEPYHVVARSGRCYLVGYDLDRRDWRYFALDAIAAPLRRVGTFEPRGVPERMLAQRAVGWIRGAGSIDVTVRCRPLVAAAVTARTWQEGQRVEALPGGGADVTLCVDDVSEAVRWALGYGAEALVVAPPEAVAFARQLVARIGRAYAADASERRSERTG